MRESSSWPDVRMPSASRRCSGSSRVRSSRSSRPSTPLSGVRISWLTVARKSDFCCEAAIAASRASASESSASSRASTCSSCWTTWSTIPSISSNCSSGGVAVITPTACTRPRCLIGKASGDPLLVPLRYAAARRSRRHRQLPGGPFGMGLVVGDLALPLLGDGVQAGEGAALHQEGHRALPVVHQEQQVTAAAEDLREAVGVVGRAGHALEQVVLRHLLGELGTRLGELGEGRPPLRVVTDPVQDTGQGAVLGVHGALPDEHPQRAAVPSYPLALDVRRVETALPEGGEVRPELCATLVVERVEHGERPDLGRVDPDEPGDGGVRIDGPALEVEDPDPVRRLLDDAAVPRIVEAVPHVRHPCTLGGAGHDVRLPPR